MPVKCLFLAAWSSPKANPERVGTTCDDDLRNNQDEIPSGSERPATTICGKTTSNPERVGTTCDDDLRKTTLNPERVGTTRQSK